MGGEYSDIYSDIHSELRSVASDLLAKNPDANVRLLAQAGWLGLEAPEDVGGAGATFQEVAIVAEEMGRAVAQGGYLGGAVLGVGMALGLYDPAFATLTGLYGRAARGPITGITLIAGFASTVGWPLSAFGRREESPGSTEVRCRVTPGGGDPRESATESTPPLPREDRAGGKGETVR